jgi:hypothetical protein
MCINTITDNLALRNKKTHQATPINFKIKSVADLQCGMGGPLHGPEVTRGLGK